MNTQSEEHPIPYSFQSADSHARIDGCSFLEAVDLYLVAASRIEQSV